MGSIVSGVLGYAGQKQANEQTQEDYWSTQQFNAQQAQLQRNFAQDQQLQAEAYNTQMSDTMMQRRVADLKAAGLNPMLAIAQGGASAPTMGAPSSSAASSGGPPSFGNALGAGAQSAMQEQLIQAQAGAANAQASKTQWETGAPKQTSINPQTGEIEVNAYPGHEKGDADLQQVIANTGVARQQAQQILSNIGLINAQKNNTDSQTALNNITASLTGQKLDILQGTKDAIIKQAAAAGVEAGNVKNLLKDPFWGPVITVIDRLIKPVSSAIGAVQ